MTEIRFVISKDHVMCSGRGSPEENDEQTISTKWPGEENEAWMRKMEEQ